MFPCKFGPKHLCLRVIIIIKIGFYIKIEVRGSLISLFNIIFSITIAALKVRNILIYSSVPFVFYIVCRPISRFIIYKVLFALITVLIVRGVVSLVGGVVSSVNIE